MLTILCFTVPTHESHVGFLFFQSDMLIKEWLNNKVQGLKHMVQKQNYRDQST